MPYKDSEQKRRVERERYAANRDQLVVAARARRAADRAAYNAAHVARRAANPEHRRALDRARYHARPEEHRARRRAYYAADPERHREVARAAHDRLMDRNPEVFRARCRARYAREKQAEGSCTAEEWRAVLEIYGARCLRCGSTDDITQDHVVPLVFGGTHWPWNLQPLCRAHNSAKGGRDDTDYRPDGGAAVLALFRPEEEHDVAS